MRYMWMFNVVMAGVNAGMALAGANYTALMGWLVAGMFATVLMVKDWE
jgi:hypothetical protein